jgi:RNA polymerase sigma factor (sigma-70 family)
MVLILGLRPRLYAGVRSADSPGRHRSRYRPRCGASALQYSLTIFAAAVRLQEWMDEPPIASMNEQDRQISEIIVEERSRLRNFIRRRVPDPSDVEDIVQEVFYKLVEANRLLMPIDHVTGWLFRVARNRITDLFRKKKPETFSDAARKDFSDFGDEDGDALRIEDLLPSPDVGPEALYVRRVLLDELEFALDELPNDQPYGQREVFIAHELEGRSFKELSAESGVNVNTLLSRKRYAVLHLRERLQNIYDEFTNK